MCLAVPGEIREVEDSGTLSRTATVRFGTLMKKVSLAYTPEAAVGDFVIVHVGFAISVLDRAEAERTLELLGENL